MSLTRSIYTSYACLDTIFLITPISELFSAYNQSEAHTNIYILPFFSFDANVIRRMKLTTTARSRMSARKVGPKRSSKPAWPRIRIDFARQWYVNNAYNIVAIATAVNRNAEMKAARSPKFNMPMARAPRMTVKFIHDRKVRSLAKKTLGSTRVGSAMRLPGNCQIRRGIRI